MVSGSPGLRVGIVGRRGASTAAGLRAAGARVTALCELNPEALARMGEALEVPPARRFTRFADMLAADVDAVVVGTPMPLHAPQCIAVLEAGKHALSEVSAAVSFAQCRDLLAAVRRAERHGRLYMLAENYCYTRQNVLVRALADRGAFGDPYYAEGEYLHDVKDLHHQADGSPTWRARWQVGINGCTYPTHSLGPIMQWLRREPIATVTCLGCGVHTDPEHAMEDTVVMLCKLASGRLVRVRLDMMSNRPHAMTNYTLQGTDGAYESARAPGEPDRIWLSAMGERRWHDLSELDGELPAWYTAAAELAPRGGHGGGDFLTAWVFARACQGLHPVTPSIEDALAWTVAGLCSQQSIAAGGAPVVVPATDALGSLAQPSEPSGVAVAGVDGRGPTGTMGSAAATTVAAHPDPAPRRPQLLMRRPVSLACPEVRLPEGYALRLAGGEDVEGLAHCLSRAFGPNEQPAGSEGGVERAVASPRPWSPDRVREALLEAPDVRVTYVVTDRAGCVVACASDRRLPDRFPDACYLHWVAADPAHAGRGLGQAVSAAVIAGAFAECPCDTVLETDDHRLPAVTSYLRLGFAPEYTHPTHLERWALVFGALTGRGPGRG